MNVYSDIDEIPYDVVADHIKEKLLDDGYELVTKENQDKIVKGMRMRYLTDRSNLKIKNGFFKRVSGDGIIQLYYGRRIWSIYLDHSLLFIREKKSNFRRMLDNIVNGNFTVTKMDKKEQEDI